jgi:hypothetical protein
MEDLRKGKVFKSAFESNTFEADGSIHVDRKVGSATISPSGRDIALASFVIIFFCHEHCLNLSLARTAST